MPAIVDEPTWIPELDREDLLYHRLFLAEKWLVLKLRYGHADPRDAGVGNIVNCGAAMYIAPVGIANAGDPDGAYAEALDLTAAHQSSYGREAAGVLAAAVAEALRPGGDGRLGRRGVPAAREGRAHATAIEAVVDAAATLDGWRDGGLAELRAAFAPFDSVGEHYARAGPERPASRAGCTRSRSCRSRSGCSSRPAATTTETVLGGVNYGRDSDSIASMGGALAGALGSRASRRDWVDEVSAASKIDVEEAGREMAAVALEIFARDAARHEAARARRIAALTARRGACLRVTWVQPEDLVGHELRQAREEGKDVDAIEERWLGAGGAPAPARGASPEPASPELRALALELLDELDALPRPLADREPEGFDEILAAADPVAGARSGRRGRADRGRLARPRRGLRARQAGRERSRARAIRELARGDGQLAGLRLVHRARACRPSCSERRPWNRASGPTSLAENIDGAPEDDDLNFTMLGVALLERCGRDFTSLDVAKLWLDFLPPGRIFTAERVAMRNLLEAYLPPETATHRNPFREWIGARLRVDAYGWAAAGDPVRAARMAWEDARVSHTANGVYAAMFMAAVHAASLAETSSAAAADAGPLGRAGLQPAGGGAARRARARRRARVGGRRRRARTRGYGALHWVHAINNTALVAAALYAFDGDFSGAIGGGRPGRLGHRHERRRGRLGPRRDRRAGRDRRALDGAARRTASRARCPASTRARSTGSCGGRSPVAGRPRPVRDAPGRGAARPARPAADRPADGRPARSGRRPRRLSTARRSSPRPTTRRTGRSGATSLSRWREEARSSHRLRRRRVRPA